MTKRIVESMSMEEAFRALNKKSTYKIKEAKIKGPAKAVINKIYKLIKDQKGTVEEAELLADAIANNYFYYNPTATTYTLKNFEYDMFDEDDFLPNIDAYLEDRALKLFKKYFDIFLSADEDDEDDYDEENDIDESKTSMKNYHKNILTEAPIGSNDGKELHAAHDAKVIYETIKDIVTNKDSTEYKGSPEIEAINLVKRNLKVDIEKHAAHWGYNNFPINTIIQCYRDSIKLIKDNFDHAKVDNEVKDLNNLVAKFEETYNDNKRK